jgi:hypothetical protein
MSCRKLLPPPLFLFFLPPVVGASSTGVPGGCNRVELVIPAMLGSIGGLAGTKVEELAEPVEPVSVVE